MYCLCKRLNVALLALLVSLFLAGPVLAENIVINGEDFPSSLGATEPSEPTVEEATGTLIEAFEKVHLPKEKKPKKSDGISPMKTVSNSFVTIYAATYANPNGLEDATIARWDVKVAGHYDSWFARQHKTTGVWQYLYLVGNTMYWSTTPKAANSGYLTTGSYYFYLGHFAQEWQTYRFYAGLDNCANNKLDCTLIYTEAPWERPNFYTPFGTPW